MISSTLDRLASIIWAEGGLLAAALVDQGEVRADRLGVGELVSRGPLASGHPADLGMVAESAREGYLLHHGRSRLFDSTDPDLALLAGDRCYALALGRLADAGDLDSIKVLAGLISRGAQAAAAGDETLVDCYWQAAALELGWGSDQALGAAVAGARPTAENTVSKLRLAIENVRTQRGVAG